MPRPGHRAPGQDARSALLSIRAGREATRAFPAGVRCRQGRPPGHHPECLHSGPSRSLGSCEPSASPRRRPPLVGGAGATGGSALRPRADEEPGRDLEPGHSLEGRPEPGQEGPAAGPRRPTQRLPGSVQPAPGELGDGGRQEAEAGPGVHTARLAARRPPPRLSRPYALLYGAGTPTSRMKSGGPGAGDPRPGRRGSPGRDPGRRGALAGCRPEVPLQSGAPEGWRRGWSGPSGERTGAPFMGVRSRGSHTGVPHGGRGSGERRWGGTAPIPGWQVRGPRRGCRVRRGLGLPSTRMPGSQEAQAPRCLRGPGRGGPREGGSSAPSEAPGLPEGFRRSEGRTPGPGSRRRAPRGRTPTPRSVAKPERPAASPRPPRGPRSARRRPASARTCRGPGARPGSALRAASSPPLLNGAEAALRPAQTRPIERPARRRLDSRAPSHRGGAPWRERPLLQRSAGPK